MFAEHTLTANPFLRRIMEQHEKTKDQGITTDAMPLLTMSGRVKKTNSKPQPTQLTPLHKVKHSDRPLEGVSGDKKANVKSKGFVSLDQQPQLKTVAMLVKEKPTKKQVKEFLCEYVARLTAAEEDELSD
jgi:hypothetical protein